MSIIKGAVSLQNQLIPNKNNLARWCVDSLTNHAENSSVANGIQSRILTISSVFIFFAGAAQSCIKFACHLAFAVSGQEHKLKKSGIELVKIIGAIAVSVGLCIPTTVFPSYYQINEDLFKLKENKNDCKLVKFNGEFRSCGTFGDFVNPKNFVTFTFKPEATNYPRALMRQLSSKSDLKFDRIVIDGPKALELVKNLPADSVIFKADVVVFNNILMKDIGILTDKFRYCACFDFGHSKVDFDIRLLTNDYIVITAELNNLAYQFNKLNEIDFRDRPATNNPAAKLLKHVELTNNNYSDEDVEKIATNLRKHCPRIQSLTLDNNTALTVGVLKTLVKCKLESLSLKSCDGIYSDEQDLETYEKGVRALVKTGMRHFCFGALSEGFQKVNTKIKEEFPKNDIKITFKHPKRKRSSSVASK